MTEVIRGAWIAAIAAIVGGAVGGLLPGVISQLILDRWYRPILKIDFPKNSGIMESLQKSGSYKYVRVRVTNQGRRIAKECRVFLAKLEEVHPKGHTVATVLHDAKQLAWAGFKFVPVDLPRGLDFYADLLRVPASAPEWQLSVEHLFGSQQKLKAYSGTYRFHLVVTSNNAELATCVIDVTYPQNWQSLHAVVKTVSCLKAAMRPAKTDRP